MAGPVQAVSSSALKLENNEHTKDNHDNKHTIEINQPPGVATNQADDANANAQTQHAFPRANMKP